MKLGLSSYSLSRAIVDGRMTIIDAVRWTVEHGAEHMEIVPIGFELLNNEALADDIRSAAAAAGIDISNYAVDANLIAQGEDRQHVREQIQRLKRHVDIAHRLGVKLMRHDVAARPIGETTDSRFEQDLPTLAAACREIADYAAQYGITTSVENHGYYIQAAERVQRLVREVNRPNYRTTLDIGNFMCVDEDAVESTIRNLPLASMVHLKDFYWRPADRRPGEGWFPTAAGNHLRGAITGNGDIDLRKALRAVKQSGYSGYISIEFEGMEDCLLGSRVSLDNARRLWDEA